jgi:hypothetical protein
MSTLFRAVDAPVDARAEYWDHVIDQTPVPLEGHPRTRPDFHAQLLTGEFGAVPVTEPVIPPAECLRGPDR